MRVRKKSIYFVVTSSVSLRFLSGQVSRLTDQGWQATVSANSLREDELQQFSRSQGATGYPVQIEREIRPWQDLRALWHLYRTFKRVKPTVSNVGTPKAGLLGGLAGLGMCVPVRVYTLHGLRMETANGRKRKILELTERLAMAAAHRIVCVSPSLRARVHELKLTSPAKTVVLGSGSANGVAVPDLAASHPQTAALRQQYRLSGGQPVIGFVGRFTRDKGMAELMDAFGQVQRQLPEVRLLLVGEYEDGDPVAPEVRQAIDKSSGVIKTGFVPDVTPYYPLMHVLALPTYREGFPTVALEAAAAGLPVVATTATGARDAVRPGITGWQVPVADSQALAQALLEALRDPAEAQRRGLAGRTWVTEQFTPEQVQQRWADYYDELLHWRHLSRQHSLKRAIDLFVSITALTVLALPLCALALAVRIKLGSPVLFQQVRPGLAGQPFTMYKFRTMTDACGPDGALLPDGERLTPFGRFLRSTSLDELPELFNILKGDMSLVGPRPLLMEYLLLYSTQQARRHKVRPGLTGWAQVNGRNSVSWDDKFKMDVWYVDHVSLALDLKILWMTVVKVLKQDGISGAGEATMTKFMGSRPPSDLPNA